MYKKVFIVTCKVYFLMYYFADQRRNVDWLMPSCPAAA